MSPKIILSMLADHLFSSHMFKEKLSVIRCDLSFCLKYYTLVTYFAPISNIEGTVGAKIPLRLCLAQQSLQLKHVLTGLQL